MGTLGGGDGLAKELGVVKVGGSQLLHRSIIENCKTAPSGCALQNCPIRLCIGALCCEYTDNSLAIRHRTTASG